MYNVFLVLLLSLGSIISSNVLNSARFILNHMGKIRPAWPREKNAIFGTLDSRSMPSPSKDYSRWGVPLLGDAFIGRRFQIGVYNRK